MNRRDWLRGAALAGLSGLPFLRALHARAAGEMLAPKRLVLLIRANGNATDDGDFKPRGSGALTIDPGSALSPLLSLQNKVSVVSGMTLDNFTGTSGFGSHLAWPYVLTCREGASASDGGWDGGGAPYGYSSGGVSLDQHVAAALGQDTPLKSLVIRESPNNEINFFVSYAGAPVGGLPNSSPTLETPAAVWQEVFGGRPPTMGAAESAASVRRRLVHPRVERAVREYASRLGAEEKRELDAHLTAVQEAAGQAGGPARQCAPVAEPQTEGQSPAARFDSYASLMVEAMRCDITRVICFLWPAEPSAGYGWNIPSDTSQTAQPDQGGVDEHGGVGHMDEGGRSARTKTVDRWYVERFASLLEKMDAVKEGDGSMLDNSLVVLGNRDADHRNHSYDDLSWVVAGGAGGAFRGGQAIRWVSGAAGQTDRHSHLLVTLCAALGVDAAGFAREGDRAISELLT